jgi:hypothetical protein
MLKADQKELEQYEKMLELGPRKMTGVIAKVLTKQAMSTKFQHMPYALEKAFTIRDKRFMGRQLWVNKASQTKSPDVNFSEAGSLEIKGGGNKGAFTGWSEQQEGKRSEKDRTATQASRIGGAFKGKMRGKSRMKNADKFRRASQFMSSKRVHSRAQALFFMFKESRASNTNMIIRRRDTAGAKGKVKNLKAGIYGWKGKRLMRVQTFGERYDPKKVDWRGNALKRLIKKRGSFDQVFEREFSKIFND